jgi:hypothetical protein
MSIDIIQWIICLRFLKNRKGENGLIPLNLSPNDWIIVPLLLQSISELNPWHHQTTSMYSA